MSDDQIVCLCSFAKSSKLGLPPSLEEFVELGAGQIQKLDRLLKRASKHDIERFSCSVESVSLLAPIKSPRKIVCLGLNYRDHAGRTECCRAR